MAGEFLDRKPEGSSPGTWARWPGLVAALLVGVGLATLVLLNPFELAFLDEWLARARNDEARRMAADEVSREAAYWTCGMHPQVLLEEPGWCPICGMALVPARFDDREGVMKPDIPQTTPPAHEHAAVGAAGEQGVVTIDPAVIQNMGVLTEKVTRRDLSRTIRYLDYDQERMVTITTKYEGFVEKVYVNYLGQTVRKGEPLFEIYSPELVQTEQELLSALDFALRMEDAPPDVRQRTQALVDAAKARLAYWDITPEQIERLQATGQVFRSLAVVAPIGGMVMKRTHGLEGMAVKPGMDLIHIADLSTMWLSVEVFEDQLPWLKPGNSARVLLSYVPGQEFTGKIRFIEPEVSEKTRTVKLTMEVPNPGGGLRAGMYATVEFDPVIARDAVLVPGYAVLRTGDRNVVIVALGGGRFAPRDVVLGLEGDDWAQVLSGLDEGESVVTSSQFLIDSESNLREAINKMIGGHTGHEP
jgi:RND family efflux transporter MFP subunit